MKTLFRLVALLEGLSYILLLFVAVPLKYISGEESFVELLGMPHGLLFMAYIFMAFYLRNRYFWTDWQTFWVYVASIIPFGTFYIDKKFLR